MKRFNTYLIEKLKVSAKTLDIDAFNDEFNEFLFDYTSKIPVEEIEKAIREIIE